MNAVRFIPRTSVYNRTSRTILIKVKKNIKNPESPFMKVTRLTHKKRDLNSAKQG